MNYPKNLTDAERELHIKHCGELMQAAYARGHRNDAVQWLHAQNAAIKSRSDGVVAHHDCYFHAMGAADALRGVL